LCGSMVLSRKGKHANRRGNTGPGHTSPSSRELAPGQQFYREILQMEPANAEALHLLGVLAYQVGQSQAALGYLQQALALNPADASFHSDLGLVYQAMRRGDEAIACHRQALRL